MLALKLTVWKKNSKKLAFRLGRFFFSHVSVAVLLYMSVV